MKSFSVMTENQNCFVPNAACAFGVSCARSESLIHRCGISWGITAISAIFVLYNIIKLGLVKIIDKYIIIRICT